MHPASLSAVLCACALAASSPPQLSIMHIQGRGHVSPVAGDSVTTLGVVTAVLSNGFYLQDPLGDGDPATSDGIFAFTGSLPAVAVGDEVRLIGTVSEFLPGNDATNLTVTEFANPRVDILSRGHVVSPTTLPCDLPTEIIDDDYLQVVDPASDGIDFYESLESMLVRVPDAVAVSVPNVFNEWWVRGPCATGSNARGGITISAGDMNPERIQIDDARLDEPVMVSVGDRFGDIVGVLSYRFGSYELLPGSVPVPVRTRNRPEATTLHGDGSHLTIASFNLRNLHPEETERIVRVGSIIAVNLESPDIVALVEVQDDSGPVDDGTVDAAQTSTALIDAIREAGGPLYEYRDIAPRDGEDGGEPGGNIRVGFLFRPDRVAFVDRGRATAVTSVSLVEMEQRVVLSHSPGRIDPLNDAWRSSRKPLAAEFRFAGATVFVVACHFTSRGGSTPLFGATQPPITGGEAQRRQQAQTVADFVASVLALDRSARVVVLGDFNDFQFSPALTVMSRDLTNLTDLLPAPERYTYNFEGNSQALDHILVSAALARDAQYDAVHVSSEFVDAASDHDPVVARLSFVPEADDEPAVVAYPNPFRSITRVAFTVERAGPVAVAVFDVAGRLVRRLEERHEPPGEYDVTWDGLTERDRPAPAGVYFIRVLAAGVVESARVVRIP